MRVCASGGAVLVLHEEAVASLHTTDLPASGEILLVVGPEGGMEDDEVHALRSVGARTVRLGPHVLRTSTAGPVAAALVLSRLGRWEVPDGGADDDGAPSVRA